MDKIATMLPAWITGLIVLLTGVMLILSAVGAIAPNTRIGAWCRVAASDIRTALGRPVETPAGAPKDPRIGTVIVAEKSEEKP